MSKPLRIHEFLRSVLFRPVKKQSKRPETVLLLRRESDRLQSVSDSTNIPKSQLLRVAWIWFEKTHLEDLENLIEEWELAE